jgi:hypothetical protein
MHVRNERSTTMQLTKNRKTVASLAAAALVAVGGGTAVAASSGGSPAAENQAIVDDVAAQLGVDASKVTAALKTALANRVDAALSAGRITQAQADELKAQIEAGTVPFFAGAGRGHGPGGPGHFADLDAVASYLGVTVAQLRADLQSGKTLAEIATAAGKSVDGLVAALVAAEKQELDDAVAAGRLTDAQRDSIATDL